MHCLLGKAAIRAAPLPGLIFASLATSSAAWGNTRAALGEILLKGGAEVAAPVVGTVGVLVVAVVGGILVDVLTKGSKGGEAFEEAYRERFLPYKASFASIRNLPLQAFLEDGESRKALIKLCIVWADLADAYTADSKAWRRVMGPFDYESGKHLAGIFMAIWPALGLDPLIPNSFDRNTFFLLKPAFELEPIRRWWCWWI